MVRAGDLETGELFEVETTSKAAREAYATRVAKQRAAREQLWKRLSLDHLTIHTHRSYVRPIADLFRLRQRRERLERLVDIARLADLHRDRLGLGVGLQVDIADLGRAERRTARGPAAPPAP